MGFKRNVLESYAFFSFIYQLHAVDVHAFKDEKHSVDFWENPYWFEPTFVNNFSNINKIYNQC